MTEKEVEKLNGGRLLRDAATHLLPLLEEMREQQVVLIVQAHRAGNREALPTHAAELSVIESLRGKITRSNKETEIREGKLFNEQTSR